MTSSIHAMLQAPLVMVLVMTGFVMLYRAQQTIVGNPVDRSPALQMCLGLMLVALAVKQMFWQIFWALRATDAVATAAPLLSATWIATVLNATAIILGSCTCVLAARPFYGAYAVPIVVGALVATTAATAVMVVR